MGNIAPGKTDVLEFAGGQLGEFAPRLEALVPDVQVLDQLRQKVRRMIICHQMGGVDGHLQLLELSYFLKYRSSGLQPQTTICTICHELMSCDWTDDCPAPLPERLAGL